MAKETNSQLRAERDQLQKKLDQAKATIAQLEDNVRILGQNVEAKSHENSTAECQILKRENAELYVERRKLKNENKKLREYKEVLEQRVHDLEHSVEESHRNTETIGKTMEESSDYYLKQIQELQNENQRLRSQTEPVHNARGAGRKKNDAAWMKKYNAFCDLVRSGKTMSEIMDEMQISRSTYFRFLKSYKEDCEIDEIQEEIRKNNQ